ncbi:MAG: hydantoinase B/oxoprolinase family protein [Gammaproteobacteria bacterium]|nr:hydantoinase B/oxoprolinase family protein [Gammaproteobacteria bacterium]
MSQPLDPITVEIVANALRSITDETFIALMKSAYSTNIKERHDHSTAIMDKHGRLVTQATPSLPLHITSLAAVMRILLEKHGDTLAEGDIFVANDPHVAGGTHLPDVILLMPVFYQGELAGFVGNLAHHADIGGMAAGSMSGGMSEIYQEGLRIPVVRLFKQGELQEELFELLLLNVRIPEERRGDYYAQIAACRLGARRLIELFDTRSVELVTAIFADIIDRTAQRMRDAIRTIPDGTYQFEDCLDSDGLGTTDIVIALEVTVSGDQIRFDFSGTAKQMPGNLNTTMNACQASVSYALKALLDPEIPNSQGVLDSMEIYAEPGSVINAVFPAPVAARAHTSQRIVDVVLGALSKAIPDRVVAAANGANTTAVFSGIDPRTGQPYVYLETLGGGVGGRPMKDGKDGVQAHCTNTSNLPVEAIEMEYPLLVEEYSLVTDSGGAGKYRGGLGLRRVVRPLDHACTFDGVGERFRHQPWGLFGGHAGGSGRFLLEADDGQPATLNEKTGEVKINGRHRVIIETPGAGGYGAPRERAADALASDEDSGKFTPGYLGEHYPQHTGK